MWRERAFHFQPHFVAPLHTPQRQSLARMPILENQLANTAVAIRLSGFDGRPGFPYLKLSAAINAKRSPEMSDLSLQVQTVAGARYRRCRQPCTSWRHSVAQAVGGRGIIAACHYRSTDQDSFPIAARSANSGEGSVCEVSDAPAGHHWDLVAVFAHVHHPHSGGRPRCWSNQQEPLGFTPAARSWSLCGVGHPCTWPWPQRHANPLPRRGVHACHGRRSRLANGRDVADLVTADRRDRAHVRL